MPSITLATYALRVRERRSREFLPLGNAASGASFHRFLKTFFTSRRNQVSADEQTLQHVSTCRSNSSDVWGTIEAGEFGYAADGVNVTTMKKSFRRSTDDAELLPFYFRVDAPDDSNVALLALQRFGPHGVYQSLKTAMRQAFEDANPDQILDVKRVVPSSLLRAILQGDVIAIEVTSYSVPPDIADHYHFLGDVGRSTGRMTIEFRARSGVPFIEQEWLKRLRRGIASALEFEDETDGKPSTLRLKLQHEGKVRTVQVGNLENLLPYVDVTDEIKLGGDGHPVFESINKRAQELLAEVSAQLRGG